MYQIFISKIESAIPMLKAHTIVKLILFVSSLFTAIIVLLGPFNWLVSFFKVDEVLIEMEKQIQKIDLNQEMDYIESIYGMPHRKEQCDNDVSCSFKGRFDEIAYYENDYYNISFSYYDKKVMSYSIFLKDDAFQPSLEIFLSRFSPNIQLVLGKTRFKDMFDNDVNVLKDKEMLIGAYTAYYWETLYSNDYAADYILVTSIADYPGRESNFIKESCNTDYFLEEKIGDCSIYGVSFISKDLFDQYEGFNLILSELSESSFHMVPFGDRRNSWIDY